MTFERGLYLGRDSHDDVTGGKERSTLMLGPTRSGTTSSFIIPNLLLAPSV
jgi:type IV secretory pathway TraG/TraD family ATPase VirD4